MSDVPYRKQILLLRRKLEFATDDALRELYLRVYGAEASGQIPTERVRESLYEACDELLDKEEE